LGGVGDCLGGEAGGVGGPVAAGVANPADGGCGVQLQEFGEHGRG
jgi:hypothetical protein